MSPCSPQRVRPVAGLFSSTDTANLGTQHHLQGSAKDQSFTSSSSGKASINLADISHLVTLQNTDVSRHTDSSGPWRKAKPLSESMTSGDKSLFWYSSKDLVSSQKIKCMSDTRLRKIPTEVSAVCGFREQLCLFRELTCTVHVWCQLSLLLTGN